MPRRRTDVETALLFGDASVDAQCGARVDSDGSIRGFKFELENMDNENEDTELLLSLLAEVEEQLARSRGCVHDASNKFEEGKEFEVEWIIICFVLTEYHLTSVMYR